MPKRSEQARKNISEAMIRRYMFQVHGKQEWVTRKRCNACGKWGDVATPEEYKEAQEMAYKSRTMIKQLGDFRLVRYKLKSGVIKHRPSSQCRKCSNEKARIYRNQMRAEGKPPRKDTRNEERRREYQREYKRQQRERAGIEAQSWSANRNQSRTHQKMFPVQPLLDYLDENFDKEELAGAFDESLARAMRRARDDDSPSMGIRNIDKILLTMGASHMLNIIYPMTDSEAA